MTLLTFAYPRAAKDHRCAVCGTTIPKGVVHHYQTSAYDGTVGSWRAHSDCAEMHWHHNDGRAADDQVDGYYLDEYRGRWPHAVCRIEFRLQVHEARERDEQRASWVRGEMAMGRDEDEAAWKAANMEKDQD